MGEGSERENALLFHLFVAPLVVSSICSEKGSNPQP